MEFPSRDGVQLSGRSYDGGDVALVLAHMSRPGDSQLDWADTAQYLTQRGYTVLTYNRRGKCDSAGAACSEGVESDLTKGWLDMLGAVDYLTEAGHQRVFVGGASIGATTAMRAAEEDPEAVAGVFWFAGQTNGGSYRFSEADVQQLPCPKLFITTDGDGIGVASIRSLMEWAPDPKVELTVEGNEHGTDVFRLGSPSAAEINEGIADFLDTFGAGDSHC